MTVLEAQKEVRTVFLGGSVGQAVSGVLWVASAAAGTWVSSRIAMVVLFLGGMLIFPLTQLALKISGRRGSLAKENADEEARLTNCRHCRAVFWLRNEHDGYLQL
jgi:hypothetical protein